jgi:hypothetical protein
MSWDESRAIRHQRRFAAARLLSSSTNLFRNSPFRPRHSSHPFKTSIRRCAFQSNGGSLSRPDAGHPRRSWGGRRQASGIRAIARSIMALCLLGHSGLACTVTGASEDINTTAVYINFLVRKKKWLQDGANEIIWLKIHIKWTVGQFYY